MRKTIIASIARRSATVVFAVGIIGWSLAAADESSEPDGAQGSGVPAPAESDPEWTDQLPLTSLRIAGSTLRPREDDVSYTVSGSGGCVHTTAGDASTVWNHKLTLPLGSRVDTLRMYYNDTSGSNSTAWFTIYDLYGTVVQEWSVSTAGSSGNSFSDSAVIDHVVDYSVYSYALNWRPVALGSGMQLCGFRIFYVDPLLFDDGFESGDWLAWSAVQP